MKIKTTIKMMIKATNERRFVLFSLLFALTLFSSCVQKMGKDGHLRTYEERRTPPSGTIARGQLKSVANIPDRNPYPITRALLARGQERYNIYCSPCHDYTGNGYGMIVQRGFLPPPSYHTDRLRNAPDRHFYDVISNGFGAMYSYGDRVVPSDRWAITAYIRALQLSQNVSAQSPNTPLKANDLKALQEMHE
jgi:mono/diheme cytochrome c family protein